MLDSVRTGVGLAHLAEWYVAEDVATGRLVRVLHEWTPPFPGLAMYYPAGRHMNARDLHLLACAIKSESRGSQVGLPGKNRSLRRSKCD